MKYRKKPIEIEAIQFNGKNIKEIELFLGYKPEKYYDSMANLTILSIKTIEGTLVAMEDDWIIKGIRGEFYPCKPDIFKLTYEKIED
jgi:hypothetical protein